MEQGVTDGTELSFVGGVGVQNGVAHVCKGGAASILASGGGIEELAPKAPLCLPQDGPGLGVGHIHVHSRRAQGVEGAYPLQEHGNAWAKAFFVCVQPKRDHRMQSARCALHMPLLLLFFSSIARDIRLCNGSGGIYVLSL